MGKILSKQSKTSEEFRQLLLQNFPELRQDDNLKSRKNFKPVYFVGAGISKASGLPDFREFGMHILNDLFGEDQEIFPVEERSKCVAELRPEVLLQTLHDSFGDSIFHYYDWFAGRNLKPCTAHYFLAKALREGNPVMTTNVDDLIERAYKELYGEDVVTAIKEEDFAALVGRKPDGILFKFHGSISDISSVRFLLAQVGLGVTTGMKNILEAVGKSRCFVMMGYSGCDNFSVQPVLRNIPNKKGIIWVWHDNDLTELSDATEEFKKELNEFTVELTEQGKSLSDIPRGLEKLSTLEVLATFPHASRLKIATSKILPAVQVRKHSEVIKVAPPVLDESIKKTFSRMIAASQLLQKRGANDISYDIVEKAKLYCEKNNLKRDLVYSLFRLGQLSVFAGGKGHFIATKQYSEAIALAREGKAAAKDDNTRKEYLELEWECILGLGMSQFRLHHHDSARETLNSLVLEHLTFDELNSDLKRLWIRKLILTASNENDTDFQLSIKLLNNAYELAVQSGFVDLKAEALLVQGNAYNHRPEDRAKAEESLRAGLLECIYIGDAKGCYSAARQLGNVLMQVKRFNEALECYKQAERYLARVNSASGDVLESKYRQGLALLKLKRVKEGREILEYVYDERTRRNNWHYPVRILAAFLGIEADQETTDAWIESLIKILKKVLQDEGKLNEIRQWSTKGNDTVKALKNALKKAKEVDKPVLEELLGHEVLKNFL